MARRVLFVLIDGLGEVACEEFAGLTYLQAANLPTFNAIASSGISGMLDPVETGLACGSDTAHMSIFGYDPLRNYLGRGSFESLGAGIEMTYDDIAFKCNFSTLLPETGIVTRRRVDRDFPDWGLPLCEALNNKPVPGFEDCLVTVLHATEHRCGVRVRGKGLSCLITDTDPLKDNLPLLRVQPTSDAPEAIYTAKVVNALSDWIHEVLSQHPINKQREQQGLPPANIVLLRGCGAKLRVPSFQQKHGLRAFFIAPTAIIAGLGMTVDAEVVKVPGTTGDIHSDFGAKFQRGAELLNSNKYDFGFVHVKAVDDLAHDRETHKRLSLIQRLDAHLAACLACLEVPTLVIVTGDHTTTVHIGDHTFEPVPFSMCLLEAYRKRRNGETIEPGLFRDSVQVFNEVECAKGALGRFPGSEVMPLVLKSLRLLV